MVNSKRKTENSITSNILYAISLTVVIFIITIALIITVSNDMSKYSTLINDTGKIRGGIQRIVKLELSERKDAAAFQRIDALIDAAKNTESGRFLKFDHFEDFSDLIRTLDEKWTLLKVAITEYREGKISSDALIEDSENVWIVSNEIVSSIEKTSHYNVLLYYAFSIVGVFGIISLLIVLGATKIYVRDRIEYLAEHDQLTGLYNRHYFNRVYEREFSIAGRNKRRFGILICDIDHFKRINDQYGHPTGDLVLKEVASALKRCSRESDLTARFGGEEFVILTIDETIESCRQFAERVRSCIEDLVILRDIRITISIGLAVYSEGTTLNELIKKADTAMYTAKSNGRNQVSSAPE